MSQLDDVLLAAKNIAASGKLPTIALIKMKLGGNISMPILIQGLQQFKSMSDDEKALIQASKAEKESNSQQNTQDFNRIEALEIEVAQLKKAHTMMIERINQLEQDQTQGE